MSEQIDRLIDETARELTSGNPSPALREHVRSRLTPVPWWRVPMWRPALGPALGAAVLALVVIAVMPSGTWPPVSAPPRAPVVTESTSAAPAAKPVEVVVGRPDAQPVRRAAPRPVRASIAALGPIADEMVAEARVEPLQTEPIAAVVTSVGDIEVPMPLNIGELELRPLLLEE